MAECFNDIAAVEDNNEEQQFEADLSAPAYHDEQLTMAHPDIDVRPSTSVSASASVVAAEGERMSKMLAAGRVSVGFCGTPSSVEDIIR